MHEKLSYRNKKLVEEDKVVFEKIKEVIVTQLVVEEDTITMNTSFSDDLGIDSLDLFQIIIEIEEVFDIQIDDVEKLKTVSDVVSLIERKVVTLND